MADKNQDAVMKRLNVIIGLILDLLNKEDKKPEKNQMFRLRQLGLENPEIGIIFGKSGDQVKKQIYSAKQKRN